MPRETRYSLYVLSVFLYLVCPAIGFSQDVNSQIAQIEQNITKTSKDIESNPQNAENYRNRGSFYLSLFKYDQAMADINKALELNPDYAVAHNDRGIIYLRRHDNDKALDEFNKTIKLDPKFFAPYFNRGLIYYEKRDYRKAYADFNKSISLNPKYSMAYGFRGSASLYLGYEERTMADFNKAIELNPQSVETYFHRAQLFYRRGNISQAVKDRKAWEELTFQMFQNYMGYYRTFAGRPHIVEGRHKYNVLADDAVQSKKFDKAAQFYENGLNLDPTWAVGQFNAALIYAELKNYNMAVFHMRRYLALMPDDKDARTYTDKMYIWQERVDEQDKTTNSVMDLYVKY